MFRLYFVIFRQTVQNEELPKKREVVLLLSTSPAYFKNTCVVAPLPCCTIYDAVREMHERARYQ